MVNHLGLAEPKDGFGQAVVVGIADGYCDPWFECWITPTGGQRDPIACSRTSRTRSVRIDRATRQPMIRRAKTSITNAVYTRPDQVATYVKSAT